MFDNQRDSYHDLQQQVEMLKQQLAQAQKLTALGELVSTTTHEFNNVLTTIINYAKMGMRHKDAETRDKAFDKILLSSNRAAKITNTVLGLARNRSAGQEVTNLTELVENTLLLLEREMNKYRIVIEKSFQPIPEAYVNGNQIQQVLLNLLINARQAMPHGGRIMMKLLYDASCDMIDLVVRDNGCGIPPEKLPKIFEPFYTTKAGPDASGKGGTGLGLAMCRDMIEAHQGRIRVDSTVGKGTAFTLKLPTAAKAASKRAPLAAPITLPVPVMGPTTDCRVQGVRPWGRGAFSRLVLSIWEGASRENAWATPCDSSKAGQGVGALFRGRPQRNGCVIGAKKPPDPRRRV